MRLTCCSQNNIQRVNFNCTESVCWCAFACSAYVPCHNRSKYGVICYSCAWHSHLWLAKALVINVELYVLFTEGELTLCWRFDDELWIWFRNVTFIQLCIFCFFDRKSGQYVSKHRHFTMVWYVKGISAKNLASKRAISVFFVIIHPQQKTRFRHVHLYGRPCSETSMPMFRNVLVININAIKGTKVVIIYNV